MFDDNFKGVVKNCHLLPRQDEIMMFIRKTDGTILPNLVGYTILPREKYEALKAKYGFSDPAPTAEDE